MAIEILAEVKRHAASRGVFKNSLLILIWLADAAGADHRMSWLSVPTMMRETGMSRATVFRHLAELEQDLGVIEQVPEELHPPEADKYASAVRRILPVTEWGKGSKSQNETPPENTNSETSGAEANAPTASLKMRPNPKRSTFSTSEGETSSPPLRRTATHASGGPGARPSRAELARRAKAAEDALDPVKALDLGEQSQQGELWSTSHSPRRRSPAGPDTGMGLVDYFISAVSSGVQSGLVLDLANKKALAAAINRWKNQGATPDIVRAMVDAYAADPGMQTKGKAPWIDFLAKRELLLKQIRRGMAAEIGHTNRDQGAHWNERDDDRDQRDAAYL